jgi:hypothetical protein
MKATLIISLLFLSSVANAQYCLMDSQGYNTICGRDVSICNGEFYHCSEQPKYEEIQAPVINQNSYYNAGQNNTVSALTGFVQGFNQALIRRQQQMTQEEMIRRLAEAVHE